MEQEAEVMADYTNLAGRCTVAEQKLAGTKTHQNIRKAKSCGGITEPCCPTGGGDGGKSLHRSITALRQGQ